MHTLVKFTQHLLFFLVFNNFVGLIDLLLYRFLVAPCSAPSFLSGNCINGHCVDQVSFRSSLFINPSSLFALLKAASSLSGKISEKLLISLTNDENTNTPNQQYSLPPFSDSLVSRDGNIDSKRENHQLIVWAISKLKRIYAVS